MSTLAQDVHYYDVTPRAVLSDAFCSCKGRERARFRMIGKSTSGVSLLRSVVPVPAAFIPLLLGACAPMEPILPPVVAYKTGLTITIRNPFDCTEQTELICSQGNLDFECRCREGGPTSERAQLVQEVQALIDSVHADSPSP